MNGYLSAPKPKQNGPFFGVKMGSKIFFQGASPPGPPFLHHFRVFLGHFQTDPHRKKTSVDDFSSTFCPHFCPRGTTFSMPFSVFFSHIFVKFFLRSKSAHNLRYRTIFSTKRAVSNSWETDENGFQMSLLTETFYFCVPTKNFLVTKK